MQVWSLDRENPWRRKWQPTLVFLPGNLMDRGAWRATVCEVTKESDTTQWLKQQWTWGYKYLSGMVFLFLQMYCLGWNCWIICSSFFFFWETSILFSIVAIPALVLIWFFDYHCSSEDKLWSLYGFDLHLPDVKHLFMLIGHLYVFFVEMAVNILCPF